MLISVRYFDYINNLGLLFTLFRLSLLKVVKCYEDSEENIKMNISLKVGSHNVGWLIKTRLLADGTEAVNI